MMRSLTAMAVSNPLLIGTVCRVRGAAEVLLKRLRRGAEPHAELLEALEANRLADGAPPNPTPT